MLCSVCGGMVNKRDQILHGEYFFFRQRSSRDEAPYFVAIHGETWVRCNFFSCAKHELTHMLGFRDNLV
jgi:hypothetical protein